MNGVPLLTLVIFVPLIGALLIAFIPRANLRAIRWAALGTALAAWAVSLVILYFFNTQAAGFQFVETANWVPAFGIQ